eukprot:TRINITY_DN18903_c0_g1_i1.p1 TRINITY_DN18903_c0_g1~~TRINITY_DN18903_c0_g1_i1.p1  ORF type:complete len:159 (+),score=38.69 TRINITY_DN18903_c0_g1_i1:351-827(+)
MVVLDPDPFLNELTKLFEKTKTSGTVLVTFKASNLRPRKRRKSGKGGDKASAQASKPLAESEAEDEGGEGGSGEGPMDVDKGEPPVVCLIRVTDGKRKFSTSVSAKDHVRFQAAYATVLRAHMDALKKKEKKDKKKAGGGASSGATGGGKSSNQTSMA